MKQLELNQMNCIEGGQNAPLVEDILEYCNTVFGALAANPSRIYNPIFATAVGFCIGANIGADIS